jgi:hypothetical protein
MEEAKEEEMGRRRNGVIMGIPTNQPLHTTSPTTSYYLSHHFIV